MSKGTSFDLLLHMGKVCFDKGSVKLVNITNFGAKIAPRGQTFVGCHKNTLESEDRIMPISLLSCSGKSFRWGCFSEIV